MKAAFVLFDRFTLLDFAGVFDPLGRLRTMGFLPEFQWSTCSLESIVHDDRGLSLTPSRVGHPLDGYDLLVVPGGFGTRRCIDDSDFVAWLQTARDVPLKASVCTGSLLLGAAGYLTGRPATTHPGAKPDLAAFCGEVRDQRVVDDGDIVTAGGVTASIDLGLHLVGRLAGAEACKAIAAQMDYPGPSRESGPSSR